MFRVENINIFVYVMRIFLNIFIIIIIVEKIYRNVERIMKICIVLEESEGEV